MKLRQAGQLRQLEAKFGRVGIEVLDGSGSVQARTVSHQRSNASTSGSNQIEQRLGRAAALAHQVAFGFGVAAGQAARLAAAVASSQDPDAAAAAILAAAPLIGGGSNRWARQLASAVRTDPTALASALSRLHHDSADSRKGLHTGGPPAGLVPRDLRSAMLSSEIVAAAAASTVLPAVSADENQLSQVRARHLTRFAGPGNWAESPRLGEESMSGFKLHVYCADAFDIREALDRLAPTLVARNLEFKTPTARFAATDHPQARKGVTVYFPFREHAAADVGAVVAALGQWHYQTPPGDDLFLAPGVGLRFDLASDPGCDVSRDQYMALYSSASYQLDPHRRAAVDAGLATFRAACDDLRPPVGRLAELLPSDGNLYLLAESQPELLARAVIKAASEASDGSSFGFSGSATPQQAFEASHNAGNQTDDQLFPARQQPHRMTLPGEQQTTLPPDPTPAAPRRMTLPGE